jgi:hypothetical protein
LLPTSRSENKPIEQRDHVGAQRGEPQMSNQMQFMSEKEKPAIKILCLDMCIGTEIQNSCHIVICFGQWDQIGRGMRLISRSFFAL